MQHHHYIKGTFRCRSDTFWGECCGQAVMMDDNTGVEFNSFLALYHHGHCCRAILKSSRPICKCLLNMDPFGAVLHSAQLQRVMLFTTCNKNSTKVRRYHDLHKAWGICWHLVAKKGSNTSQVLSSEVKVRRYNVRGCPGLAAALFTDPPSPNLWLCSCLLSSLPAHICIRLSVYWCSPVFVSPASLAFQTVLAYENPSHLFFQENKMRVWHSSASRCSGHLFWLRTDRAAYERGAC